MVISCCFFFSCTGIVPLSNFSIRRFCLRQNFRRCCRLLSRRPARLDSSRGPRRFGLFRRRLDRLHGRLNNPFLTRTFRHHDKAIDTDIFVFQMVSRYDRTTIRPKRDRECPHSEWSALGGEMEGL